MFTISPKVVKCSASKLVTFILTRLVLKLRKNSKTGEWKAFDMVAEGISMLSAKQSELTPLIRTKGVAGVTELLKEHNASLNTAPIGQAK